MVQSYFIACVGIIHGIHSEQQNSSTFYKQKKYLYRENRFISKASDYLFYCGIDLYA